MRVWANMMHLLLCVLLALASGLSATSNCRPRCSAKAVEGRVVYDPVSKLVIPPDFSCGFHAFPYPEAVACLKGAWLIFFGGSTTHVVALRAMGFFKSRGLDTSFLSANKSSAPGLRNVDVIFHSGMTKAVQFEDVSLTQNISLAMQTSQVLKFLADSKANFHRAGGTTKRVDLRITLIQDRYLYSTLAFAQNLPRIAAHEFHGLKRLHLAIGPIGKWFEGCEPKELKHWSCDVAMLRGQERSVILAAYRALWVDTLSALAAAGQKGLVGQSLVLPFRNPYQREYEAAVAIVRNKLEPKSKQLLPLTQGQFYEEWFATPLAWSLLPQPYMEIFESHPSGVTAHLSLMLALTAVCAAQGASAKSECAHRPGFTRQCWASYIANAPERPRSKWNGTNGGWSSGYAVKGCSISSVVMTKPKESHRLSGGAGSDSDGTAREQERRGGKMPHLATELGIMAVLFAACAAVVAVLMRREANEAEAELASRAEADTGKAIIARAHDQSSSLRIDSLAFSRYIASVHVVAGHLHARGFSMTTATLLQPALPWGFTWVPFFFMLSGFVLAHVKVARISPHIDAQKQREALSRTLTESPLQFAYKRAVGIYSLYIVGVVTSALIPVLSNAPPLPAATSAGNVLAQALLLQAWFPSSVEQCLQAHCWFLSCEATYWLLFPSLLRGLLLASLPQLLALALLTPLAACGALIWLLPRLLDLPPDWAHLHAQGTTRQSAADLYVVVLKFHPLVYCHVFALGVVAALIFRHYRHDRLGLGAGPSGSGSGSGSEAGDGDGAAGVESRTPRPPAALLLASLLPQPAYKRALYATISLGACLAYPLLAAVLLLPSLRPAAITPRLSLRLGLLCPLHALILMALAAGSDPLARAFSWRPLQVLGGWSYAQFVLQFIAFRLFSLAFPSLVGVPLASHTWVSSAVRVSFFLFLTAVAGGFYTLVQAPFRAAPAALSRKGGGVGGGAEEKGRVGRGAVSHEARFFYFLVGVAVVVALWLLLCMWLAGGGRGWTTPWGALPPLELTTPAFVQLEMGCSDSRLNLSLPLSLIAALSGSAAAAGEQAQADARRSGWAVINPSVLRLGPGSFLLAARLHRLEIRREQHSQARQEGRGVATSVELIYHSRIVLATLDGGLGQTSPFSELSPGRPVGWRGEEKCGSGAGGWNPCVRRGVHFEANNTDVTVVTTGPQDPRFFVYNQDEGQEQGGFAAITFFSMNPVAPSPSGGGGGGGGGGAERHSCSGDTHGQVFLSRLSFARGPPLATSVSAMARAVASAEGLGLGLGPVHALPLAQMSSRPYPVTNLTLARRARSSAKTKTKGPSPELGLSEKNLLFFQSRGRLLFVDRVYPHTVFVLPRKRATAGADAGSGSAPWEWEAAGQRPSQPLVMFTGKSALLTDAIRSGSGIVDDGLIAHGGAAPIPFPGAAGPGLWLASFHTIAHSGPQGRRKYRHYLYVFEDERFDVVAVSASLPLVEHPEDPGSTFVTSLVPMDVDNNGNGSLAIFYGCADRESRVLLLTAVAVTRLFAHAAV